MVTKQINIINLKCPIGVRTHDPSSRIRLQIFDHFVLRLFEWHAHYSLSNSRSYVQMPPGPCISAEVIHVEIAVEGLQSAKTQLEAEGLLSNMKQLEF